MDRVVRAYLLYHMGIKQPKENSVERWIGFSWDEQSRCKPLSQKYQQVRWPLIEMGETKEDVELWYKMTGEEMPPPSVCNHCWANGTQTFKRISETDPEGFERAIEFDEASRDMSQFGMREKCFVSKTLMPLVELRANGFEATSSDSQALSCDSGMCFI
ncbi:MAG: hypothetical protein KDB22_25655 [Planctomycetales bacterium]|nr:hypothetical protein [Planctomycetales bacterium]